MSFMPDAFSLAGPGAAGMKHEFLGSGPLLTGAGVVLGGAGGSLSPLPGLLGSNSSPTNSSQSDTATTAEPQLSLGSPGGAPAAAAAGAPDAASRPKGSSAAAGKAHAHAHAHASTAGGSYDAKREWLYRLVTFPHYFTPCTSCCSGSHTPKREQLMTLFDTRAPHRVFCCHCPTPKGSTGHFSCSHGRDGALLQVRRSSFKNAVNANDICRFGADLGGVQQYTLNGNKIIYLAREASAKKAGNGAPPPASCTVDGRAMMDKNSLYCSLMCKMQAEDPGFTNWLDSQDPSVRIMAQVAANAPPVPTVACKRTYYVSSARDSSASPKSSGSAGTNSNSSGASKDSRGSPGGSGLSVGGLPRLTAGGVGPGTTVGAAGVSAGVFASALSSMGYQQSPNRPAAKVARLTARSSSAPLAFAAAAAGGNGSSGNEALLMGMSAAGGGRAGNGPAPLLEGLTSRPVARQLLPAGPNAAAVEAAARQAAVAAAAAAFSGAGTSAAAAAARDALGAAGLAPIRTGNGSPLYSSIAKTQQQQQRQPPAAAAAAAAAGAGQGAQQQAAAPKKGGVVSAFAAAAAAAAAGGSKANKGSSGNAGARQLASAQSMPAAAPRLPPPESPKAPGLGSDSSSHFEAVGRAISLPEPYLPGAEVPGSIPALGGGFQGVGGLLDFGAMGGPGHGAHHHQGGPGHHLHWGSDGDIAGLLGVSDSHSPMHPGLDGFDAFFGDGSLSPAPQMMF